MRGVLQRVDYTSRLKGIRRTIAIQVVKDGRGFAMVHELSLEHQTVVVVMVC